MEILSLREVGKSLQNKPIIQNISFDLHDREILGIIGPSGAGKTTILRTLIGFYVPDTGDIFYHGNLVNGIGDLAWHVGFATQDECFYDDMTCDENLRYFGTMYSMSDDQLNKRIPQLLDLVELGNARHKRGAELSGGMRRRLDMAIAMLHEPEVLILDEPTSGLDPVLRKHIVSLVERIRQQGISVIITSHILEELEQLCDSVLMLCEGQIVASGSPRTLTSQHFPYTEVHLVMYPGRYDRLLLEFSNLRILKHRVSQHELVIATQQPQELVYAIMQTLPKLNEHLIDISIKHPTLNEVFEKMVNRGT